MASRVVQCTPPRRRRTLTMGRVRRQAGRLAGFLRKPLVLRHSRAGRRLVGRAHRLIVVSVLCFRVLWIVGWDCSAGLSGSALIFMRTFPRRTSLCGEFRSRGTLMGWLSRACLRSMFPSLPDREMGRTGVANCATLPRHRLSHGCLIFVFSSLLDREERRGGEAVALARVAGWVRSVAAGASAKPRPRGDGSDGRGLDDGGVRVRWR